MTYNRPSSEEDNLDPEMTGVKKRGRPPKKQSISGATLNEEKMLKQINRSKQLRDRDRKKE